MIKLKNINFKKGKKINEANSGEFSKSELKSRTHNPLNLRPRLN
jgi:hypothetical protein